MAWQEIDAAEIAPGAPISQELLQKMDLRDKAVLEGPAGGRWDERTIAAPSGSVKFLTLYVPKGVSSAYFECIVGVLDPSTDAKARIVLHDVAANKYAYGEFTSLKDLPTSDPENESDTFHFGRVAFPAVKLDPESGGDLLRGKIVECLFEISDAADSEAVFHIVNKAILDPDLGLVLGLWSREVGFGVRFGGPLPRTGASTTAASTSEELIEDQPSFTRDIITAASDTGSVGGGVVVTVTDGYHTGLGYRGYMEQFEIVGCAGNTTPNGVWRLHMPATGTPTDFTFEPYSAGASNGTYTGGGNLISDRAHNGGEWGGWYDFDVNPSRVMAWDALGTRLASNVQRWWAGRADATEPISSMAGDCIGLYQPTATWAGGGSNPTWALYVLLSPSAEDRTLRFRFEAAADAFEGPGPALIGLRLIMYNDSTALDALSWDEDLQEWVAPDDTLYAHRELAAAGEFLQLEIEVVIPACSDAYQEVDFEMCGLGIDGPNGDPGGSQTDDTLAGHWLWLNNFSLVRVA